MKFKEFSHCLEFEFEGNVLKNSMCLGDINGDGMNELVVGNDKGIVSFFSSSSTKPIYQAITPGTVSAVAIGDALNIGKNVVVVITTCGVLHIYDIIKSDLLDSTNRYIEPVYAQRIMANIKSILIGDVNGDGWLEIIVGLTDRVVRTYRWFTSESKSIYAGKFLSINKWDFAEQVGGLALYKPTPDDPYLLVSQPSGSFYMIKVQSIESSKELENVEDSSPSLSKITLEGECTKLRNAEMCGCIRTKNCPESFAIATLDGWLILINEGKILWKEKFEHPLFSISCLSIYSEDSDTLIACAWDGATVFAEEGHETVMFQFREAVSSFCTGFIGHEEKQKKCLAYATYSNRVYVYYDLEMPAELLNLIEREQKDDELCAKLRELGIDPSDKKAMKKMNTFLLYDKC